MPGFVIQRLRRPPPSGGCVVSNSTPVLGFGDFTKARIATLGINSSRVEFLDNNGVELDAMHRRLESLTSLGHTSLADAPIEILHAIVEGCRVSNTERLAIAQAVAALVRELGEGSGLTFRGMMLCALQNGISSSLRGQVESGCAESSSSGWMYSHISF